MTGPVLGGTVGDVVGGVVGLGGGSGGTGPHPSVFAPAPYPSFTKVPLPVVRCLTGTTRYVYALSPSADVSTNGEVVVAPETRVSGAVLGCPTSRRKTW